MKNNDAHFLEMRMDVKDMLNYRATLESRRKEALRSKDVELYEKLSKAVAVTDMMLDTVWVATMEAEMPKFKELTGGDFDITSLKLALPAYSNSKIEEDTQIDIAFVEDSDIIKKGAGEVEVVPEVVVTTVIETPKEEVVLGPSAPAAATDDFMTIIEKLLSKGVTTNIPEAIKLYNKETGKTLPVSHAYMEIKSLLPNIGPIKSWDANIATQCANYGLFAAYKAVKKHFPGWNDIDVGTLVEDAVKRATADPKLAKIKDTLEAFLAAELDRDTILSYKLNPAYQKIVEEFMAPKAKKDNVANYVGFVACAINPKSRRHMEVSMGRKPYVEGGYPEVK